jgi:ribosomal protein S18 acetylase RimI-like enzyme
MKNSKIEIQIAVRDDIPSLIKLFLQSEEYHRTNRPDVFAKPPLTELEDLYLKFIENSLVTTLLAKEDDKAIGFIRYRTYEAPKVSFLVDVGRYHAIIEELVVSSDQRRRGIGKTLITEAENRLRKNEIRHIQLNVFSFNLGAQALYETLGYQPLYSRLSRTLD